MDEKENQSLRETFSTNRKIGIPAILHNFYYHHFDNNLLKSN